MNFYLKKLPNGRVYLSQIEPTKHEEVLKVVDAEMWIKAREQVSKLEHSLKLFPDPGYGYIQ